MPWYIPPFLLIFLFQIIAYCEGKNETYLSIIMAFSEAIIVQVTRSVDTEFGHLSTQEQMTVDAIVQAR
jgi:hypothetical protein